jgi:superfamily II DNA or RNA helicase
VRVRKQRWRVTGVRRYGASSVLTLVGTGPLNAGDHRDFVTPFDSVEPLPTGARRRVVRMREWRRRCRLLLAEHGPASMLRTAVRARIELLPHQLEPALAIVRGTSSRVLVADEVGLGKTIQAGLVVSELIARGAANRVLVLAPAGLREQWAQELRDRFELDATVVDMREIRRRMSALPIGLNPWSTLPIVIASVDYVKRSEVLPAVMSCRWDVVVIDEAHEVGRGSDRFGAASALCRLAPHVLLLTATPHSGDREAFLSMCGLGSHEDDRLLAFRRNRRDCGLESRRHVHRLIVRPSTDEMRMYTALTEWADAVRAERGEGDRDAALAISVLHKRALSSAWSLEQSVLRRLAILPPSSGAHGHQLELPLDDGHGDLDPSDEAPTWTGQPLEDVEHERRLLERIASAASAAAQSETKIIVLGRLLRRLGRRVERAIVFTEYRDTLVRLRDALALPCVLLHGGMTREERRAALSDFISERTSLLLATDAAGEGLNLQHNCRVVINLELPWNPVRLEQRAGRVDRIGQSRPVHVFYLIASDTAETRVLQRLKERVALARRDIETADPLGLDEHHEGEVVSNQDVHVLRLADDAAAERDRLNRARAVLGSRRSDGFAHGDEEAVARAKRSCIRAFLASRVLVIVRSALEDATGRVVASHLCPLLVKASASLKGLRWPELVTLDPSHSEWHADSIREHLGFWTTRLVRERAIAAARLNQQRVAMQPGLFDRRVEREQQIRNECRLDIEEEGLRHVDAAERLATVALRVPNAVLVLLP